MRKVFSKVAIVFYIYTSNIWVFLLLLILPSMWDCHLRKNQTRLRRVWWYLTVVLFYINDTEHLCISLFAICTSSLVKYLNLWHFFFIGFPYYWVLKIFIDLSSSLLVLFSAVSCLQTHYCCYCVSFLAFLSLSPTTHILLPNLSFSFLLVLLSFHCLVKFPFCSWEENIRIF